MIYTNLDINNLPWGATSCPEI